MTLHTPRGLLIEMKPLLANAGGGFFLPGEVQGISITAESKSSGLAGMNTIHNCVRKRQYLAFCEVFT
jgi:hypothetical protein